MLSKLGQITIFYGEPIGNAAEAACLRRLKRDLATRGIDAVLLANLTLGPKRRQIDLIVATNTIAVAVEIKGYVHSVKGSVNGPWTLDLEDGEAKSLGPSNPYQQALTNRYAVTDQLAATLGIASEKAKNAVMGMLCLFPAPWAKSQIPTSDFKLTLGGYDDLLSLLKTTGRDALPLREWRRFAQSLSLNDGSMAPPTEEETTVSQYLAAYSDLARVTAAPYIEPQFDGLDTTSTVADRIIMGVQAQIVGASGSGKTELMKAVARMAAHAGCLPIFIHAGEFERQLAPLLQAAIARCSPMRPPSLFRAATQAGAEILLFVDGLNECPAMRRGELIAALQAARIRFASRVVLTTQEPTSLPVILSGEVIRLAQPDTIQSQRLVAAHLGREMADHERLSVEVVATAHDAAVLAAVLETPSSIDGRFALYDSFVRKRLGTAQTGKVERSLATLATTMRTNFVSSLPVLAAGRILNRNMPTTMDLACTAGLVRIQDNRLAFRHDLIADYFASNDILHHASSASELRATAQRPINAELREFLLGGCGTTAEVEALIGQTPDLRLLRAALSGRAGTKARNYVIGRLRDLISALKQIYSKIRLELPEGVSRARDLHSLVPRLADGADNAIDQAYLSLVPYTLRDGLLPELLDLFAAVDRHLVNEAQRLRSAHPELRVAWQTAIYASIYGMHHHHTGGRDLQNLLEHVRNRWFNETENAPVLHLGSYLDSFEALSPGQIFLLVSALRAGHSDPLPSRFPELLRHIWDLRIYHLKLSMCDVIRFRGADLPETQRRAISEALHGWMSNDNIFMNGIIIDALEGVDGIEIVLTVDDAINEYEAILALPDSAEACSLAVSAVTRTYDHPFRDVYWEAFYEALPVEKRQSLLLRGLRDEQRDPWTLDDILRALLREPTAAAAPELQELAQLPILQSHSPQLALNVYANSITLLAKLAIPLAPANLPPDDLACRAWYRAAPLLHAMNGDQPIMVRGSLDVEVEEFRACGIAEAFDVIQRLVREKRNLLRPANVEFECAFPDLILELCRAVLSPGYRPISVFDRIFADRTLADDHFDMALLLLQKVGRTTDIGLVSAFLDDPKHGERALQTARILERGSQER